MKIDSDTIDAIKQVAELIEETGMSEIEITAKDQSIRLSKGGTAVMALPKRFSISNIRDESLIEPPPT